jgi:topoisomerase-4 subunit A
LIKRFSVTSITRDKEYDVTKGTPGSRILYFTANPNGEAEVLKVYLKPKPKIRKLIFEYDFSEIGIKGRSSNGNILSKHDIHKIIIKEKGVSTLGGRKIWFDDTVLRLNAEDRGKFIVTFNGEEKILVMAESGYFRTCSFDLSNHFEDDILVIEKFNPEKIFTAVFYDAEQEFYYLKRFSAEETSKECTIIGDHEDSKLVCLSGEKYPRFEIYFGGKHDSRENEIIDANEFISVKSFKARGKRVSTYEIENIVEIEPIVVEEEEEVVENPEENTDNSNDDVNFDENDENASQMTLGL